MQAVKGEGNQESYPNIMLMNHSNDNVKVSYQVQQWPYILGVTNSQLVGLKACLVGENLCLVL